MDRELYCLSHSRQRFLYNPGCCPLGSRPPAHQLQARVPCPSPVGANHKPRQRRHTLTADSVLLQRPTRVSHRTLLTSAVICFIKHTIGFWFLTESQQDTQKAGMTSTVCTAVARQSCPSNPVNSTTEPDHQPKLQQYRDAPVPFLLAHPCRSFKHPAACFPSGLGPLHLGTVSTLCSS